LDAEKKRVGRRGILGAGCAGIGWALLGGAPGAGYAAAEVRSPARVSGRVRYAGRAARPARLKLTGDCDYCRKFELRAEDLLQSPQGGLRNVVVFLEGVARGKETPARMLVLAENRCTFVPHVLSIAAGGKLLLHNQDPVLNTFHAVELASGRTLFNIGMPNQDQKIERRIRREGVVKMLCDVHPWEVAYVAAFSHPYHVVTDAAGAFTLEGVPPGSYALGLWHEKLGVQKQKVEVGPGSHLKLELTYPG
jgi:hypothetical protein